MTNKDKRTRRMHKRPMKAMSFRFDERLYNQFIEKATENDLSVVQALEHLMIIAVNGILDLKTPASFDLENEEVVFEFAGVIDQSRMVQKLKELIKEKPEFLPSVERYTKSGALNKPIVIRFPRFRVELSPSELVVIENNKLKATITDQKIRSEIARIVGNKVLGYENIWPMRLSPEMNSMFTIDSYLAAQGQVDPYYTGLIFLDFAGEIVVKESVNGKILSDGIVSKKIHPAFVKMKLGIK